jgi:hypothetical protein
MLAAAASAGLVDLEFLYPGTRVLGQDYFRGVLAGSSRLPQGREMLAKKDVGTTNLAEPAVHMRP